jgi:uncharacterized protein (TIGR03083 family)
VSGRRTGVGGSDLWVTDQPGEGERTVPLSFDRLCAEIVGQTKLLRTHVRNADLTTPVPTCPGWNVGQLLQHVVHVHRAAVATVRGEGPAVSGDEEWRDVSIFGDMELAVLDRRLADGARSLAETLRECGPAAEVASPADSIPATAMFPARRMAHETLVHRADAALALGRPYEVDPEVAADALDEWMLLTTLPEMFDLDPRRRELLGPGRTLSFEAVETDRGWLVDLTSDAMAWRRGGGGAAVTVRASLTDLLLLVYRRRPVDCAEVVGDRKLLELWMANVSFG